jgi:hypothetical protein
MGQYLHARLQDNTLPLKINQRGAKKYLKGLFNFGLRKIPLSGVPFDR